MTTSDLTSTSPTTVFVWIWLPDATEPVVCGRLDEQESGIWFTYAQSYRARENAVAIYEPELPIGAAPRKSADGDRLPLCIDDAMSPVPRPVGLPALKRWRPTADVCVSFRPAVGGAARRRWLRCHRR